MDMKLKLKQFVRIMKFNGIPTRKYFVIDNKGNNLFLYEQKGKTWTESATDKLVSCKLFHK
jgi:hypothetical protein